MPINLALTITLPQFDGLRAALESVFMSALSDAIAQVNAHVDQATTRVQADIADLTAKIAALQATVDSGGATPADLSALADLQAKVDALDPANPTTLPVPPPAGP